jgi:hypothetical protein
MSENQPKAAGKVIQVRTPNASVTYEDSEKSALGRKQNVEAEILEMKLQSMKRGFVFKKAITCGPAGE